MELIVLYWIWKLHFFQLKITNFNKNFIHLSNIWTSFKITIFKIKTQFLEKRLIFQINKSAVQRLDAWLINLD